MFGSFIYSVDVDSDTFAVELMEDRYNIKSWQNRVECMLHLFHSVKQSKKKNITRDRFEATAPICYSQLFFMSEQQRTTIISFTHLRTSLKKDTRDYMQYCFPSSQNPS